MRTRFLAAAAGIVLLIPAALPAQAVAPGTEVERITLAPGQSASFMLAPGIDHQLLKHVAPDARGAITIRYQVDAGQSVVTAVSHAGHALRFTVLADPDGNGGFDAAGEVTVPGDGTPASRAWPGALGTINVGDFVGGPHGDHAHKPTGE